LDVILSVHSVAKGRVVCAGQHGLSLTERLACQDGRVLERHGIAFLRHNTRDLHVGIIQTQEHKSRLWLSQEDSCFIASAYF
jgi:hypothetical protein